MFRPYLPWALPVVAVTVAGAVILATAGDSTARIGVGLALLLFGVVLLTSLAFYAVGRSEDRDRERER
jgi:ABC-type transport system involved in cytochrome bd biosynthesis fused ATPase/permease subunit